MFVRKCLDDPDQLVGVDHSVVEGDQTDIPHIEVGGPVLPFSAWEKVRGHLGGPFFPPCVVQVTDILTSIREGLIQVK